jgi:Cu/Ag efflux protein CusF
MSIDHENRTVVLEGGEGESIELEVGEEAVNFKQIQTGDMVIAEYLESVALFATEPGSGESAQIASAVALAVEGEMPGGMMADTVQVTAVVEAIDYETRTVTLRGPSRTTTMHVDERAKRFDNIKQGDEVHFVYTEAVAISVTKAEADKE